MLTKEKHSHKNIFSGLYLSFLEKLKSDVVITDNYNESTNKKMKKLDKEKYRKILKTVDHSSTCSPEERAEHAKKELKKFKPLIREANNSRLSND